MSTWAQTIAWWKPIDWIKNKGKDLCWYFLLGGSLALVCVYFVPFNGPPIRSDGLGYYQYLPAAFIYQDIGLQKTIQQHYQGNIPDGSGIVYLEHARQYLIKYPIGEAILLSPAFLLALAWAGLTQTPLTGFSLPFQVTAALSGLLYGTAGVLLLKNLLLKKFQIQTVNWILVGIIWATPLFHYATYDSIFSHIYSFFLFCWSLSLLEKFYDQPTIPRSLLLGSICGLILITRPTNGLWLLFVALYGVQSLPDLLGRLRFWFTARARLAAFLGALFFFLAIQLSYWLAVTGHPLVYSYREESFNFLQPEIWKVLFSVRKGLFFWSPLLLTVVPGLYYLRLKAPEYFVPACIFLPLNVFVIASWHCWFYGGSFGMRPFVESLPLFALALASLYEGLGTGSLRRMLQLGIMVCTALSVWLMLKYWTGVIPFDGTTWDYFVETFFQLKKYEIVPN